MKLRKKWAIPPSAIRDPLVDLNQQGASRRLSQMIFEVHKPVPLFESVKSNTSPCRETIPSSKFVIFDLESISIADKTLALLRRYFFKALGRTQSIAMKRGTKVGILKSSKGIHWKTAQPYVSMLVLNDIYVVRSLTTSQMNNLLSNESNQMEQRSQMRDNCTCQYARFQATGGKAQPSRRV